MNPGLAIFQRMQRLQGGTAKVNPDPEAGQRMFALPLGFTPPLKDDDEWKGAPRRPLTRKELKSEPESLRDIIRSIPWREPFKGPQFNPRDIPVFQGDQGKYYDPEYSSSDLELLAQLVGKHPIMAQGGAADISMKFARSEHPPRQMSTWADYFEMLLNERDVQEKERLKRELGLEVDPDMTWNPPTERPPDEGQRQRLQAGTEEVPPWLKAGYQPQEPGTEWVSPSGVRKRASAKDAAGLYAPSAMSQDDEQGHGTVGTPEEQAADDWEERKGIVNDYEQARLTKTWMEELAPDEVDEILNPNSEPSDWSDSTREKLGEAFGHPVGLQPTPQMPQYAQGTNNVGLRLFMAGQGLRRKKRKL